MPQYLTTHDIEVTRGRGYDERYDAADEAGNPVDMTGWSVVVEIRGPGAPSSPPQPLVVQLSNANGKMVLGNGFVRWNLPAADADLLVAGGDYWWDMKLTEPGQSPDPVPPSGPARVVVYEKVTQ